MVRVTLAFTIESGKSTIQLTIALELSSSFSLVSSSSVVVSTASELPPPPPPLLFGGV